MVFSRSGINQRYSVLDAYPKQQNFLLDESPDGQASTEDRMKEWTNIINEFSDDLVDWSGYEKEKSRSWQGQLHLFEVPF